MTKVNISSSTFTLSNSDSKTQGQTSIICSVPVSTIQGGYIFYNNITNFKSIFRNNELSSINIQLQDPNHNYIDFNNIDWSITLQLDVVREVFQTIDNMDDIYNNIKNEI